MVLDIKRLRAFLRKALPEDSLAEPSRAQEKRGEGKKLA